LLRHKTNHTFHHFRLIDAISPVEIRTSNILAQGIGEINLQFCRIGAGLCGTVMTAEQGYAYKHEDGGPDEDDEGITLEA
jgi:hypothetical protein